MSARVLLVDDDKSHCEWVASALSKRGLGVVWRTSADEALALIESEDFDVVLTDLNMRGLGGIDLCERMKGSRPDTPVVVVTAFGSLETAVAAIRAGAYDFVTKPLEIETLHLTVERAVMHRSLRQEVRRLRRAVKETWRLDELIGASPAMRKVYDLIDRIAETDSSVLVTGESGTGKELVAQAVHRRSRRRSGPFVAVNCSAVPEALLESELFGHTKGAFTDAYGQRAGLFVRANGGTLFLDEIGELPVVLQPKLLRALQERRVRPVGSDSETPFDARLVAATNRDLELAVEERRFREDLYYRINVLHVALPSLRERGSDVLLLAHHFLEKYASTLNKPVTGVSSEAAEKLIGYAWPGNVRELQNCIERAVALARFDRIVVEDLPEKIRAYRPSRVLLAGDDPAEVLPVEEVERRYILWAVEALGGNKTLAAQRLGLDRKTLFRKLGRYRDGSSDKPGGSG
ncbi:MAG: sigma-54-dependent Fis family transcriptional regulator [Deltaproteobacteria bacterium]|nr:sigma-54-dependent Fis family transcriptional regulator [Deltaproteobacteria bacterium]